MSLSFELSQREAALIHREQALSRWESQLTKRESDIHERVLQNEKESSDLKSRERELHHLERKLSTLQRAMEAREESIRDREDIASTQRSRSQSNSIALNATPLEELNSPTREEGDAVTSSTSLRNMMLRRNREQEARESELRDRDRLLTEKEFEFQARVREVDERLLVVQHREELLARRKLEQSLMLSPGRSDPSIMTSEDNEVLKKLSNLEAEVERLQTENQVLRKTQLDFFKSQTDQEMNGAESVAVRLRLADVIEREREMEKRERTLDEREERITQRECDVTWHEKDIGVKEKKLLSVVNREDLVQAEAERLSDRESALAARESFILSKEHTYFNRERELNEKLMKIEAIRSQISLHTADLEEKEKHGLERETKLNLLEQRLHA
eukprot:PhF_6_TR33640/c0_g1_i1/m.49180